jgi:hypothetical protein
VNDASLWTTILIQTRFGREETRLDNFLSFLGMQLDRTADRLLDVTWVAGMSDELFAGTLQLIRQKAPFSRWRSLKVKIFRESPAGAPWSASDTFTNLESLLVWQGTDNAIISAIDGTITSRLDVLDLRTWSIGWHTNIMTYFARSFTHISTLLLFSFPSVPGTSPLPANVINLRVEQQSEHLFPYIQTYELKECTFARRNSIDLRSMTTLIVRGHLTITCQVFLPALREFKIGTLRMDIEEKIEAPALVILHFIDIRTPGVDTETVLLSDTDRSLLEPGYLLSPNTSIAAGSYLPITSLITILVKSPKVTHATLRFDDWGGAQIVLGRLLGFATEPGPYSAENKALCPKLSELRLDFEWELSEPSESKEWLLNALESKKNANIMSTLSVYVGWKGEGTYVLLTSCRC